MIVVNDRWVIDVDAYNYIVCKNKPIKEVKDGKEFIRYPSRSYHRTLSDALQAICDEEVRISLGESTKTLAEAVTAISEVRNEVMGLIDKILEDDGR